MMADRRTVTDSQTDGFAIAYSAVSIIMLSRAKNVNGCLEGATNYALYIGCVLIIPIRFGVDITANT